MERDKLDLLLEKEQELVAELSAIRVQINNLKNYRKKKKIVLNQSILDRMIERHNIQQGQEFDNEITGAGKILYPAYRQHDTAYGIYFLINGYTKRQFAEMGGAKFNAIIESRLTKQKTLKKVA